MEPQPTKEQTKSYGHWMGIFAWIAVLVVLTLIFDKWLAKSLDANYVDQKVVTISGIQKTVITRNRFNHYLAEGKVNGNNVIFLVDTGATEVVIPGVLAQKLNLTKGSAGHANTAGGLVKIYRTKLDSITIGHITINNVRASINPSMPGTEVLLGMSALKHVTFTQKGNKLILSVDN